MEANEPGDPRAERANALYWDSDHSVNQIADQMDLSKGTLYGLIRPLPADLPCPRCGADMEYPNRTARDRGFLVCSSCELEEDEEQVREEWNAAAAASPGGKLVVNPGDAARPPRGRWALTGPDPRLLGGGLLLAAAGFWLVRSLRGR